MMKKVINEILNKYLTDNAEIADSSEKIFNVLLKDNIILNDAGLIENSSFSIVYYRISQYLFCNLKECELANKVAEDCLKITSIFISPKALIGEGLELKNAEHTRIGENIKIGKNLHLSGKVALISDNYSKNNKRLEIGHNFIINNASIIGCVQIGNNVKVESGCTVLDDICDDCEVRILSSLQMLFSNKKNLLPSQKLFVYGVVPKFKNQIVIYGEGFYNPIIDIKVKNCCKKIESEIAYWDKNTIIIKIKPINIDNEKLKMNKIIIKSNGYKCVVNNSMGLVKILR